MSSEQHADVLERPSALSVREHLAHIERVTRARVRGLVAQPKNPSPRLVGVGPPRDTGYCVPQLAPPVWLGS
jgi:hypothetical protein